MTDSTSTSPQIETRKQAFMARFFFAASMLLLIFFIVAHVTRADILLFASVFPMTLWIFGGVFVSLFASRNHWQRTGLIVAWLIAGFLLGDSPQNILRTILSRGSAWDTARADGKALRVISLNCQSEISAVEDLAALDPDVIFTQESLGTVFLRY